MLEIKGKLHHDFDRPALSEHIDKLQSKEKQKLELVCKNKDFYVEYRKQALYKSNKCISIQANKKNTHASFIGDGFEAINRFIFKHINNQETQLLKRLHKNKNDFLNLLVG